MTGLPVLDDILAWWPQILGGLGKTALLAVIITITGLIGGIGVFYLSLSRQPWVRRCTDAYISFFIGMPLIVLLFLMYYGLPQWGIRMSPLAVAVTGFTMNVSAYNARYMMSAYNALDSAELEAARSQGFGTVQVFALVILPQVLRLSVPALTNQAILNLKDSSVAFLVQYTEFFAQVQEIASGNFRFFETYLFAAIVYLALVSVIVLAARWLERVLALPGMQASAR